MKFNGHAWTAQRQANGMEPETFAHLGIGHLPGLKRVALYSLRGSVLELLAYFRTERAARIALKQLDLLVAR